MARKEKEVTILQDKDIMRMAIKARGTTQQQVAEKMGTSQNALSANMNRGRTSVENFKKILDALDYDIFIVDRKTGEAEWCVDVE